jgi:CRP/FNR family transcriptional regulator, dissimilatory nitrate respiration regulator
LRDGRAAIRLTERVPSDVAPLRNAAIAATLRSCQLFFGLPAADLEGIAAFSVLRNVAKDSYLFREGDAAEGFYVVQKGAINVHRVSPTGKEQVIHVFRPGESLAEAALASEHGYPANGRAVEASAVVVVPKAPFLGMLARRPDLALRMLGSMSQHLRVLVGLVDDLTLKDVETRFLNWLLKRCGRQARGAAVVQLGSTKRVLAAELATSSETLSRTFAKLRDEGLLNVRGASVHIADVVALEARFRRLLGEG